MQRTLLLFDVDGTLLVTGGATSRCIHRAAREVLGEGYWKGSITPGLLDPQIFAELARQCGFEDAAAHLERYKRLYLSELEAELGRVRSEVKVLPGVREVLAELAGREDVVLGLLTGNFRRAVELKLAAAGLNPGLFRIGVFAEDGRERHDLVAVAMQQFEQWSGERIAVSRVVLVGDTPRDIACARQAGCRAVAVATGWYSAEKLKDADVVMDDLSSPRALHKLLADLSSL